MKIKLNILKQIFFIVTLISLLILPYFVFAQISLQEGESATDGSSPNNPMSRLENVGTGSAYAEANAYSLSKIIGQAVNVVLGFLGVVFIVLIILAGYRWMTAGGNEEAITKAKGNLKSSIIGLLITVGAYAIWGVLEAYLL